MTDSDKRSNKPVIEFLCDPDVEGTIPSPEPAVCFAPDWFKQLDRDMGVPDMQGMPGQTIKACLPVTDAFSLGYIIPLPYDVTFGGGEGPVNLNIRWADDCAFQPIEQHHPGQLGAPNPPFADVVPLKFINPWRVRVPEGYSVLFQPVMNRPELPFWCFSGLVDCDRFATTINFPFIWTGGMEEFRLDAGTPIIQVIPIKRDTIIKGHAVRASTADELEEQDAARHRKYNEESTYRKEWRVKK